MSDSDDCLIKSLDDLQSLLKLCRKQGITDIKLEGLEIKFGELPRKPGKQDEAEESPTDELTPEQLAYYSVGGGLLP